MDLTTWKQQRFALAPSRSGDLTISATTDTTPDSFDVLMNSDGGCGGVFRPAMDDVDDLAFWDEGGSTRWR